MFQFRRFPAYAYLIQRTLSEYCSDGFPHSEICGSRLMCSSPQLIAACHVLLRLLMPRHSPCALSSLTFVGASSISLASVQTRKLAHFAAPPPPREPTSLGFTRIYGSHELCRHSQKFAFGYIVLPLFISKVPQSCFLPSVACSCTLHYIVQFSRCRPLRPLSRPD